MTDSLLLRLPPELRDQVYSHVLGRRIVHVQSESFLRHHVEDDDQAAKDWTEEVYTDALHFGRCYESADEQQAYEVSQQARTDDPFGLRPTCKGPVKDCRYCKRHRNCWHLFDMPIERRGVPLFLVCSQICREAEAVLYSNTTFSFNLAYTMKIFVQRLNPIRINQIKTLHLEMSGDAVSSSWSWDNDDIPSTMKMLNGLTTLHVSIHPAYPRHCVSQIHPMVSTGVLTSYPDCADRLRRGTLSWWKNDLALFRHQKLQRVTVILEDHIRCPIYTSYWTVQDLEILMRQLGNWTNADRTKLARLLGEKLLASWNAISEDAEIADSAAPYLSLLSDQSSVE